MKVIIIVLISFCLIIGSISSVSGDDRLETMKMFHKKNPTVCIMEPNPVIQERFHDEVFMMTVQSVLTWENEMKSHTGGNWHMPMKYIELERHDDKRAQDFPECNIFIVFEELNNGEFVKKSALGFTKYNFSHSNHQWVLVVVYLKSVVEQQNVSICIGCDDVPNEVSIKLEYKDHPENSIRKIILHEFGHALGIGHYIEDMDKFNNNISLMYPSMNPFKENNLTIGFVDKECLSKIYGKDGFGGIYGFAPAYYEIINNINSTKLEWNK